MATTTTNYGLTKPSYGDNADIAVINSNMDKIDAKMKEIEDAGGGGASTWAEVENKPFETVGSGLNVDESGALNVTGGGSGGSSVEWNQIQTSGAKIAEITIDGNKTDVYAPNSSGGGASVSDIKEKVYTGNGNTSLTIEFDSQPKWIIGWFGDGTSYTMGLLPFNWGADRVLGLYSDTSESKAGLKVRATYSGNSITLSSVNADSVFNGNGKEYKILYI